MDETADAGSRVELDTAVSEDGPVIATDGFGQKIDLDNRHLRPVVSRSDLLRIFAADFDHGRFAPQHAFQSVVRRTRIGVPAPVSAAATVLVTLAIIVSGRDPAFWFRQ